MGGDSVTKIYIYKEDDVLYLTGTVQKRPSPASQFCRGGGEMGSEVGRKVGRRSGRDSDRCRSEVKESSKEISARRRLLASAAVRISRRRVRASARAAHSSRWQRVRGWNGGGSTSPAEAAASSRRCAALSLLEVTGVSPCQCAVWQALEQYLTTRQEAQVLNLSRRRGRSRSLRPHKAQRRRWSSVGSRASTAHWVSWAFFSASRHSAEQ
mmetsp:Transcript_9953/g.32473  ORF Transcript_9953/g.32473 Transcript_9953/m.32473 type:complete len:211 (-) Transcript_9953:1328-1960(-)